MIVKQLFIILAALCLGMVFKNITNIPIPSNVLGFALLFLTLCFGLVKVHHVDKVSGFIIQYLALFFVVPLVGVMVYFDFILDQFIKIFVPLFVSIILGYFVSGKVTEILINIKEGKKKLTENNNKSGGVNHEYK